MRIGIIKKYLLREANVDEFKIVLIKENNSTSLEIESDNAIVFKKNFMDETIANEFVDSIIEKKSEKIFNSFKIFYLKINFSLLF